MNTSKRKKNAGFTIVETLVAIFIITLVITGVTKGLQKALSSYIFSKDEIIGFFLAQESFEKIKNMRDNNVINGRNWLYGIAEVSSDPCYFGSSCTVVGSGGTPAVRCSAPGACPALYQYQGGGTSQGFYYNTGGPVSGWVQTNIVREVSLTYVNANEVQMTVNVSWSKGGAARQFKAKGNLFNWK